MPGQHTRHKGTAHRVTATNKVETLTTVKKVASYLLLLFGATFFTV